MIDAREATKLATRYLKEMYPDFLRGLQLEEVELDEEIDCWLITMSFLTSEPSVIFGTSNKQYKIFKIDAKNGKIYSMKIRTFE